MKVFIPYIAGFIIAGASFFTGAVTDAGDAVQLAFDKEALKAQCAELVDPQVNE